jgi:uncharacterized YigZ family protein
VANRENLREPRMLMLFSDSYFTLTGRGEGVFRDRGSRFLAFACPVSSEQEVKEILQELRAGHPSANHHCYAWRLGADHSAYRANDDGEPSNSAGKPILGQIQARDLTNTLVVVVRYFGGTLLGVNGLIQAYRNAAAEAIANAGVSERFIMFEYCIHFGFDALSQVMRLIKECEGKITASTYEEQNSIVFQVKKMHSERLEQRVQELYTTRLEFIRML